MLMPFGMLPHVLNVPRILGFLSTNHGKFDWTTTLDDRVYGFYSYMYMSEAARD